MGEDRFLNPFEGLVDVTPLSERQARIDQARRETREQLERQAAAEPDFWATNQPSTGLFEFFKQAMKSAKGEQPEPPPFLLYGLGEDDQPEFTIPGTEIKVRVLVEVIGAPDAELDIEVEVKQ